MSPPEYGYRTGRGDPPVGVLAETIKNPIRANLETNFGLGTREEGGSKGTNLLDLDASAELTGGFYQEFAADKDIRVDDVLSASVDLKGSDAKDVWQVTVEYYDAVPALIGSKGGEYFAGTAYDRRAVEFTTVPGNTAKVRVLAKGVGRTTVYVFDSYTDVDGTNLNAHNCESPGGSYTSDFPAGAATIQSNELKLAETSAAAHRAFSATDAVGAEGDREWSFDWRRNQLPTAAHLNFLARSNNSVGLYDGLGVRIARVDANQVSVSAIRGLNGVIQENTALGNIPVAEGGGQIRLILSFSGATMTVYREPWGGGTRTLVGSKIFASSYQDANHRRFRWVLFSNNQATDVRINVVKTEGELNQFGFWEGAPTEGTVTTKKAMLNRGEVAIPFAYPIIDFRAAGALAIGDMLRFDGNFFVNIPTPSANFAYRDQANVFTQLNTFNADVVMGATIRRGTADGSDSERLVLAGGGAAATDRGAFILLHGNEWAAANGDLELWLGGTTGRLRVGAERTGGVRYVLELTGAGTNAARWDLIAANDPADGGTRDSPVLALTGVYDSDPTAGIVRSTFSVVTQLLMTATTPAGRVIWGIGAVSELLSLASAGGVHVGTTYTAPPLGGLRTEGDLVVETGILDSGGLVDVVLKRNAVTKLTLANALATLADKTVIGADPGGTDQLRVGGGLSINDVRLLKTWSALTNGAGAQAGTLNNAPAAGNPTKWVPLDDAGTTRYLPAW